MTRSFDPNDLKSHHIDYMALVIDYWDQISDYKEAIHNHQYDIAYTVWHDIPSPFRDALSCLAQTKGGVLTTKERNIMKSNEWAAARTELLR